MSWPLICGAGFLTAVRRTARENRPFRIPKSRKTSEFFWYAKSGRSPYSTPILIILSIPLVTWAHQDRHAGDGGSGSGDLRKYLAQYLAMHIGQAKVTTGIAVRQLLVIEAEQVQDGGM